MAINAVLSIDDGATINDSTTFEVRPEVGENVRFWKNGREPMEATVTRLIHHQTENGYILIVEANTKNDLDD